MWNSGLITTCGREKDRQSLFTLYRSNGTSEFYDHWVALQLTGKMGLKWRCSILDQHLETRFPVEQAVTKPHHARNGHQVLSMFLHDNRNRF